MIRWHTVALSALIFAAAACFADSSKSLPDRILDGDSSALEELNDLDQQKQFTVLFSCFYQTQAAKIWTRKYPERVRDIEDRLNENEYLAEGLVEVLEKAMVPGNGRLRERLFQFIGKLKREVVLPILAEYLYDTRDFRTSPGANAYEDVLVFEPDNFYLAAVALGEMRMEDAPTQKNPWSYSTKEIGLWRDWWKLREAKAAGDSRSKGEGSR